MGQLHVGSGRKLSNSSQMVLNLVKKSVTLRSPCFKEDASICSSEILKRFPWKNLLFKSAHISSALSIHKMLCLMEGDTECTIQETTILLHLFQAWYNASSFDGSDAVPSMNSDLFLALRAVKKDLLQEW